MRLVATEDGTGRAELLAGLTIKLAEHIYKHMEDSLAYQALTRLSRRSATSLTTVSSFLFSWKAFDSEPVATTKRLRMTRETRGFSPYHVLGSFDPSWAARASQIQLRSTIGVP
jgi:hypothetical protein